MDSRWGWKAVVKEAANSKVRTNEHDASHEKKGSMGLKGLEVMTTFSNFSWTHRDTAFCRVLALPIYFLIVCLFRMTGFVSQHHPQEAHSMASLKKC